VCTFLHRTHYNICDAPKICKCASRYVAMRVYSLSKKLSSGGMPSLRPLRFLASVTTPAGLVLGSNGSPGNTCQWSKTHCGNAWPPVLARRSAVNPTSQANTDSSSQAPCTSLQQIVSNLSNNYHSSPLLFQFTNYYLPHVVCGRYIVCHF